MAFDLSDSEPSTSNGPSQFERVAAARQPRVWAEFGEFLVHNKRWWLVPLVVSLLLLGTMIVATSHAIAPAIYTLF